MHRIVSLFDMSGYALAPWMEQGHQCFAYDILNDDRIIEHPSGGSITFRKADLLSPAVHFEIRMINPYFMFGFGPCTDLASSGSRHWDSKRLVNPNVHFDAMALVRVIEDLGKSIGCKWICENPIGLLSTMWRKPDWYGDPCDYGGYLPWYDTHPKWPQYIGPRDAYEKRSCYWQGNGAIQPPTLYVKPIIIEYRNGVKGSQQFTQLGGNTKKTKEIRSLTPRGWSKAIYIANRPC